MAHSCLPIPTGSSCSCISASAVSGQSRERKGRLTGGRWWLSRSSLFQEPQSRSCWSGPQALHCIQHTVHLGEAGAQGSHSTTREGEREGNKRKTVPSPACQPVNNKVTGSCFHPCSWRSGCLLACLRPALPSACGPSAVLHHMVTPPFFSRRQI